MKTKNVNLVIFLFATMMLSSQIINAQLPKDPETGKVQFTGVVDLPNQTKEIIHKKAKLWITTTLKSGDNMTELNDENSTQVVGTGNLVIDTLYVGCKWCRANHAVLNFKFIVFCKENKCKYVIENFLLVYDYSSGPLNEVIETGLENVKGYSSLTKKQLENMQTTTAVCVTRKINKLIEDFTFSMKKVEKNDW